jgi:hypothetical protein
LTLPGLEPRPLSRPARSQSLYWLRYPGSFQLHIIISIIVTCISDYRRGVDWYLDLLTIYRS